MAKVKVKARVGVPYVVRHFEEVEVEVDEDLAKAFAIDPSYAGMRMHDELLRQATNIQPYQGHGGVFSHTGSVKLMEGDVAHVHGLDIQDLEIVK